MTLPQILAALSGVSFGVWPLLLNRSGLTGNVSTTVFTAGILAIVLPYTALGSGLSFDSANWWFVVPAVIVGAIGLLCFNGMLTSVTPQQVGSTCLIMIVTQICIPPVYSAIMAGHLTLRQGLGLAAALVAGILLSSS